MIKRIISSILLIAVLLCSNVSFAENTSLSDIDNSHWAYEAITELVSKGTVNGYPDGTFRPSGIVTYAEFEKMITGVWNNNPAPINREAALEMLWKHNGSPTGYKVPSIIYNQMENKESASWGYATGLMQGNDGLNLRPENTLTRAEASALIVRSSKKIDGDYSFKTSVSDNIAKKIWDNYGIFDSDYSSNDTVTSKELLSATKKLGNFSNFTISNANATVGDAASLLLYGGIMQARISIVVNSTEGITDKFGSNAQYCTAYGFENGIVLPADENAQVTKRDIALILLQVDALVGRNGFKIDKNLEYYPSNHEDFPFIIEGVPSKVYTTPYDNGAKPVDYYKFVNDFTTIFTTFVNEMEGKYCKKSAELTFIPSLVAESSTDTILRVKCTITGDTTAYELFGAGYEKAGKEFYMDIHTGEPVLNIYIPTEIAKIGKFVCNQ